MKLRAVRRRVAAVHARIDAAVQVVDPALDLLHPLVRDDLRIRPRRGAGRTCRCGCTIQAASEETMTQHAAARINRCINILLTDWCRIDFFEKRIRPVCR